MYDEDCSSRVYMWRPNFDGTKRLMCRSETLINRTMFLIGRIALDAEHVFLYKPHKRMSTIFPAMCFHGCINDCLFVSKVPHKEIEHVLEHDCKPGETVAEKSYELFWPDGSPRFKAKELKIAPKVEWKHHYSRPRPSAWRARSTEAVEVEDGDTFGYWSTNAPFKGKAGWNILEELEGLGRRPDDKFQNLAADEIVQNRGGYVDGRGGTGKSYLIKLLVEKF